MASVQQQAPALQGAPGFAPMAAPKKPGLLAGAASWVATHASAAMGLIIVLIVLVVVMFVYYHGIGFIGPYAKTGGDGKAAARGGGTKGGGGSGGGKREHAEAEPQPDPETARLINTINSQ